MFTDVELLDILKQIPGFEHVRSIAYAHEIKIHNTVDERLAYIYVGRNLKFGRIVLHPALPTLTGGEFIDEGMKQNSNFTKFPPCNEPGKGSSKMGHAYRMESREATAQFLDALSGLVGESVVTGDISKTPPKTETVQKEDTTNTATSEKSVTPTMVKDVDNTALLTDIEGEGVLREHLQYERSPALRKAAIAQLDKVVCQLCGFDFEKVYGPLGVGYIEVHHTKPVSQGGVRTTHLSDLVCVCANCHRMLHRKKELVSVEELKSMMEKRSETQKPSHSVTTHDTRKTTEKIGTFEKPASATPTPTEALIPIRGTTLSGISREFALKRLGTSSQIVESNRTTKLIKFQFKNSGSDKLGTLYLDAQTDVAKITVHSHLPEFDIPGVICRGITKHSGFTVFEWLRGSSTPEGRSYHFESQDALERFLNAMHNIVKK